MIDARKPDVLFVSLFETLNQYLEYVKGHKKSSHYRHELMVVDTFKEYMQQDMNLLEFKRHHAEDFIQWRKTRIVVKYENTKTRGQLSNSTINRNIAVLSYFFNWCIRRELFPRNNPFSMTKLPERNYREVMLTAEQVEELLHKSSQIGERFFTAISILLLTGMRRGNFSRLNGVRLTLIPGL
jgi:site-specific recombinase XerD